MSSRLLPSAVLALGLGFTALATVALVDRAFAAAAVIGLVGVSHIGLAVGLDRGSTVAAIAGGVLGLVEIATMAFGLWFILGVELGIGIDLAAAWFAPLNGYATVAASIAILAVDAALARRAALAIRGQAAVAILV